MLSRRNLLKVLAAAQLGPLRPATAAGALAPPALGPAERFNFDILQALAAEKARAPYLTPPMPDPAILKALDYDASNAIKYKLDDALYGNGRGPYPVIFLTVGQIFLKSVKMYALANGEAREVLFNPDMFTHPADSPLARLPAEPSPFAGFEVRHAYDDVARREHEGWARFVGASYFRAVGEADQFGLSARAVAQGSGTSIPEEFPDFTHFWIAEGTTTTDPVEIYALLDGPSIVGAYRFLMRRDGGTEMDITCRLHLRQPIDRLGIAPLTSMFWYSETVKGAAVDWRPEVHDSDGLAIWTGAGEHLWRPLNDPAVLDISSFVDENPRGFGLMQRDKSYDHYLDVVNYERRPCGWVEPIGPWGKGSVQLVEIPTDNEIYDNIIASWVPAERTRAGQVLDFRYKLYWRDKDPFPGDLAMCIATRLGKGGFKGAPRSDVLRFFMVEFEGDSLAALAQGVIPDAMVTTSTGKLLRLEVEASPDGARNHWRVRFDLDPGDAKVADLRCHLAHGGKPLSETWCFKYIRFDSPEH